MGKFIEEFYYGNIDPQARSTKQNKAVQKQMKVLMLNEDFLTEVLSGENKKEIPRFCKCVERGKRRIQSRQFYDGVSLGS